VRVFLWHWNPSIDVPGYDRDILNGSVAIEVKKVLVDIPLFSLVATGNRPSGPWGWELGEFARCDVFHKFT
jgi:hypothetical protein